MAYGTPATPQDIEPYYTHIRRGRPPTPELLEELRERYAAIGGISPLLEITRAQVAAIERELGVPVALGMKHAPPFIEETIEELVANGAERIAGVVLAPHYSRGSIAQYAERAQLAAGDVPVSVVRSWHLAPGYLEFLAAAVADAMMPGAHVLFTAHSLPLRVLEGGDPYPEQLAETAAAVAALAGLERWSVAWQSAGRTADPWIGPDVLEAMEELAPEPVLVCSCGFVADHLEVLYDLDIEAAARAKELGMPFARTRSPNDDPRVMRAVADAVRAL
jgi:ferrochelatase